jgi:glucokinase
VSGVALQRRASTPGRVLTAADVFGRTDDYEAGAGLITAFVEELAFHLVNLAILVNPARIAVGGGMTRSWDRIQPRLAEALRAAVPYPPELVLARFPNEAPLLGAVALAIDAAAAIPLRQPASGPGLSHLDGRPGSVVGAENANTRNTTGNL